MSDVVRVTEVFGQPGMWFEDPDGDVSYRNTVDVPRSEWIEFRDAERRLRDAERALRVRKQAKAHSGSQP